MTLVFDVWINDKFLDKDQSHKHYNIFSHPEKNFLIANKQNSGASETF
jgi:hypothetical protein